MVAGVVFESFTCEMDTTFYVSRTDDVTCVTHGKKFPQGIVKHICNIVVLLLLSIYDTVSIPVTDRLNC